MPEIIGYADTLHTEQDTRLKVIDPLFHQVLGWPLREINTEDPAGVHPDRTSGDTWRSYRWPMRPEALS